MRKYIIILFLFISQFSDAQVRLLVNGYKHATPPPAGGMDTITQRYIAQLSSAGYTTTALDDTLIDSMVNKIYGRVPCHGTTMNISSLVKAVYPVMGSSAATHAINLASVNYNVTWSGTVTHTNGYYQGNGSTGYGNTGFNPNGKLSTGQGTLFEYIKTVGTGGDGVHDKYDICASDGNYSDLLVVQNNAGAGSYYGEITDGYDFPYYSGIPAAACWAVSAPSASSLDIYKNGVKQGTTYTTTRTTTHPNYNFYIGAANYSNSASNFSDNKIGFLIIADGMTSAQNLFIYNMVNDFITQEAGHAK